MKIDFILNGESKTVEAAEDAKLLWVLREQLKLTGTKFGCGMAVCGACTVHLNGKPIRSCATPLSAVNGHEVTTIEGLDENNNHPLQIAFRTEQVPQCGYCQSGQIMQAVSLLDQNPTPTDEQIIRHMDGNLCRCGTYTRVLKAIKRVVEEGQS